MISSETIPPRSPNKAPDAPTETLFLKRRAERTAPPKPDKRYTAPIRTARKKIHHARNSDINRCKI